MDVEQMPIYERLWFCGRYDRRDQEILQAQREEARKAGRH